ncbi:MAG: GDSL-type esterase/lipase family protein [Lachnospiraceae bacterium]|nr:GDSL-type esterase/lipase family protein [Lachnospiraceae bacterium]
MDNRLTIKWNDPAEMQVLNPYLPSYEYVADGEPHVFGDRLYVFGSHDLFNGDDFCLGDYAGYSAPVDNLADWKCHGIIYRKTQDPRNEDGKQHMCAPDVVQGSDGRFYLYYQLHALTCTSIAVADKPEGPYEFYGYVQHEDGTPWGEKKGDAFVFDPGLLRDDDGSIYLYAGFSPLPGWFKRVLKMRGNNVEEAVCFHLDHDMKTVIGGEHPIVPGPEGAKGTEFEGHAFFEASSPRRINGKYYYIYSSELSHELCYAVSEAPDQGFHYGGTIISIGNIGFEGKKEPDNYTGNTHGGLVEVDGQWYVFYHRQTNMQKCARQACAEKITILPDGSIPQAETTSCGLNRTPLNGFGTYEARIAATLTSKAGTIPCVNVHEQNKGNQYPFFTQSGEDREENPDQYVANMRDGATAGFRYFMFEELAGIGITIRKSTYEGRKSRFSANKEDVCRGMMEVRLRQDEEMIAQIPVDENMLSAGEWTKLPIVRTKAPCNGVSGIYFTYRGKGSIDFKEFSLDSVWNPICDKPDPEKRRVLCAGDSITYGHGVASERDKYSYPAILEQLLGSEYQVLNYGLCGRTLLADGDVPYVRDSLYLAGKSAKPEILILMLGTNDAKVYNWNAENYRRELKAIIEEYQRACKNVRIILMTPPKAHVYEPEGTVLYDILDENVKQAGEIVQSVSEEMKLECVDLYRLTENHPEWFGDGVHPVREGNEAIANEIVRVSGFFR